MRDHINRMVTMLQGSVKPINPIVHSKLIEPAKSNANAIKIQTVIR
jgi:hypothetical protein